MIRQPLSVGVLALLLAACGGRSRERERGAASGGGASGGAAGVSAAGATGVDKHCVTSTLKRTRWRMQFELVVSTATSMGTVIPGDGRTRLEATQASLLDFLGRLDPGSTAVGVSLVPSPASRCGSVVAPLLAFDDPENTAQSAVESAIVPGGDSSLERAFDVGMGDLRSTTIEGRAIALLFTDGDPNDNTCGLTGESLEAGVQKAAEEGLRTLPVYVPGSTAPTDRLKAIAQAGTDCVLGDPCFLDYSASPDFGEALASKVARQVAIDFSCDFDLPVVEDPVTDDPDVTALIAWNDQAPVPLPERQDCGDEPGFTLRGDALQGDLVASFCPRSCGDWLQADSVVVTITVCE